MEIVVGVTDNGFDRAVMRVPAEQEYPFTVKVEDFDTLDEEGYFVNEDVEVKNRESLCALYEKLYPEGWRIESLADTHDVGSDLI